MPLINDHEAEQRDDGREEVVEVEIAISLDVKLGVFQFGVSTIQRGTVQGFHIVPVERNFVLEEFHPQDSPDVVENLETDTQAESTWSTSGAEPFVRVQR